jgi:hypothetical protein
MKWSMLKERTTYHNPGSTDIATDGEGERGMGRGLKEVKRNAFFSLCFSPIRSGVRTGGVELMDECMDAFTDECMNEQGK